MNEELTRDEFRNAVLKRDGYKCIICGEKAQFNQSNEIVNLSAHHIMERRLFKPNGSGYLILNGATLCELHHIEAEQTILSCDKIRELAGIKTIVLPQHLYEDVEYDKWGNEILRNGMRIKG